MVSDKPEPVRVVICGAGPAGLLLAHYLLSHGNGKFHVSLFERGDDPREVDKLGPSIRRYSMGINMRGIKSFQAIPGLFEKLEKVMVLSAQVGIFLAGNLRIMTPAKNDPPGYLVDRFSLCAHMLQHLVDSHQDSGLLDLRFHTPCTAVDLSQSLVSFRQELGTRKIQSSGGTGAGGVDRFVDGASIKLGDIPPGSTQNGSEGVAGGEGQEKQIDLTYDLLVGADGVRSAVRFAFQSQIRNFNFETRDIFNQWHVIHLPQPTSIPPNTLIIVPKVPKSPALQAIGIPALDGSHCFLWGWPLNSHPHEWYACKTPAEAKRYVDDRLPFLEISEEKAWEFLKQPAATTMQVKCWTYHDEQHGRSVLVGDAAHATSPAIGNGCNSSLSDVSVLARLLLGCDVGENNRVPERPLPSPLPVASMTAAKIRARMPAVLSRYSALQVKEGHALVDLSDANATIDKRLQVWNTLGMIVRSFLSRLLPFLVQPPLQNLVNTLMPYHRVYKTFQRDTEYALRSNTWYRNTWYKEQWRKTVEGQGSKKGSCLRLTIRQSQHKI